MTPGQHISRALLAGILALAAATPVPPDGPACVGGKSLPVGNQSGLQPDCPGLLQVHNASCSQTYSYAWDLRAQYHPGSACHGENDPNGPFFYKGVFHLFFQDHNPMQLGGHLASKDLINWHRLPIAIW